MAVFLINGGIQSVSQLFMSRPAAAGAPAHSTCCQSRIAALFRAEPYLFSQFANSLLSVDSSGQAENTVEKQKSHLCSLS